MHVWAEGDAHRVHLDRGICWCRLWRRLDADKDRSSGEAKRMAAAAGELLKRGLRPIGIVVDLAHQAVDPAGAVAALAPLLETAEDAEVPIAVIDRSGASTLLEAAVGGTAPFYGRVFGGVPPAEGWIRAGGPDGEDEVDITVSAVPVHGAAG